MAAQILPDVVLRMLMWVVPLLALFGAWRSLMASRDQHWQDHLIEQVAPPPPEVTRAGSARRGGGYPGSRSRSRQNR